MERLYHLLTVRE